MDRNTYKTPSDPLHNKFERVVPTEELELFTRKEIKCSKKLESLCTILDNEAAVSYILSLEGEIDLKTTKMLLLIAEQIKKYYEARNEVISKEQLSEMLQMILTTPKLRAYIVNEFNSKGKLLMGKEQNKLISEN